MMSGNLTYKQLFLLLVTFLYQALQQQNAVAQKVTLNLDTSSIRIGEQVRIKLNATLPKSAKIYWPAVADTFTSQVEILNRSKVDTNATTRKDFINYSQAFTITSFDTGFHYIPPVAITFSYKGDTLMHHLETEGVYLSVRTVEVDTTRAIRDIKPNMQAPITFSEVAPLLGLLLGLAIIATLIWYYLWRKQSNKPLFPLLVKPQGPPWETALKMLGELREKRLWQQGKTKEYYTELTEILRQYLNRQHHIDALEMVSSEIIEACSQSGMNGESLQKLQQILGVSDFVKFAKAEPHPRENEECLEFAFHFIESTKPVIPASSIPENTAEKSNTSTQSQS